MRPVFRPVALAAAIALASALGACGDGDGDEGAGKGGGGASAAAGGKLVAKVEWKDGSGREVHALKPKDDGAKLVDATGAEMARYKVSADEIKVKGPDEKTLGYIDGTGAKIKVKDAEKRELFILRHQDDGDWKLEDPADKLIYRIKRRDYGYEVHDASDRSLYKAKRDGDKTQLRDPEERTTLYTKDGVEPAAAMGLGFEVLDLPMRAGLTLRLMLDGAR